MSTALPPDQSGDAEHAASPADEPTRGGGISADEPTRVSGSPAEATTPLDVEGVLIEGYRLLEEIHRGKTARLIAASVVMGGLVAGAGEAMLNQLRRFGHELGLAFQVIDDILDVTGSSTEMGKTGGRDEALEKATTPGVLGLEAAARVGRELADRARTELAGFDRADALLEIADLVIERRS